MAVPKTTWEAGKKNCAGDGYGSGDGGDDDDGDRSRHSVAGFDDGDDEASDSDPTSSSWIVLEMYSNS